MKHPLASTLFVAILLLATSRGYAAPWLYWTDTALHSVQRAPSDGTGPVERLVSGANGVNEPRGIALDLHGGKMYWAESGSKRIRCANLDGSNVEDLVTTGLSFPADIQLDLANGKLYLADRDRNAIRRCDLNGANLQDVRTGATQAYFLYVDVPRSRIYWSEDDAKVIHRASLDGTGAIENVVTGLSRVRDVAMDPDTDMFYWNDRSSHKVQRRLLSGGTVEDLFTTADGLDRPHGLVIDLDAQRLYWTDTTAQCIRSGRTDGAGAAQLLYSASTSSLVSSPWGITLAVPPCRSLVSPDLNQDCYVDKDDISLFASCFTGPLMPMLAGCDSRDFDDDGDVDQADFGILQRCYSGSRLVADPGCDD